MKTVLTLSFTEGFRPWLELRDVIRVVGQDKSAELSGQPLTADRKNEKERIVLQMRALEIHQEAISDFGKSLGRACDIVDEIHVATPLPTLQSIRYELQVIDPFPAPFHALVTHVKLAFLRPSPLVDVADDVGVSMDQHDGDILRHLQIGPMVPQQLQKQFLVFPREKMPDQFIFALVSYEQERQLSLSREALELFLRTASDWQMRCAQDLLDQVRKAGGA